MVNERNRGFSLIELLAAVAILALLMVAAVPAVNSIATNSKKNMFCKKVQTVERSAQMYAEDSIKKLGNDSIPIDPSNTACKIRDYSKCPNDSATNTNCTTTIDYCEMTTVQVLIDNGYVTLEKDNNNVAKQFIDPKTGRSMLNDKVMVYILNKRVYAQFIYNSVSDAQDCTTYVDYKNTKQRFLYYKCKSKPVKRNQLVGQKLDKAAINAENAACR